ncbi:hypothetical protein ACFC7A_19580 [Streptomyces niveus]|uniref:hypothetical protein n=1 Tax=Streptomyces niveus TaxID=193462 RepID=UPI0035DB606D
MVSNHGKKSRARKRARRTGAAHQPSITNTLHTHEPPADVSILPLVPHGRSRLLDLDLAALLVVACRAGCRPCQKSLVQKTVAEARSTLAALAGAVFGTLPALGPAAASGPTLVWAPLARDAIKSRSGDVAFAAVDAMDPTDAAELLEDALDHWAAGDLRLGQIVKLATGAQPQQVDPKVALREVEVEVAQVIDTRGPKEIYGVFPSRTMRPDGRTMPMITLYPESEGAGFDDLEARTDWEDWDLRGMPDADPTWRVRARIADRSLQCLVHVAPDGEDDDELWRVWEPVSLPEDWWTLLNRVQHLLVAGPVKEPDHQVLRAAGDAGELLAAVVRVSFH